MWRWRSQRNCVACSSSAEAVGVSSTASVAEVVAASEAVAEAGAASLTAYVEEAMAASEAVAEAGAASLTAYVEEAVAASEAEAVAALTEAQRGSLTNAMMASYPGGGTQL